MSQLVFLYLEADSVAAQYSFSGISVLISQSEGEFKCDRTLMNRSDKGGGWKLEYE